MSNDGEKVGLSAAVNRAMAQDDGPPASDAEQMSLLPLDRPAKEIGDVAMPQRGPGRPMGATNKRTQVWADFLLSQYSSPLQMLAETISMPLEDLAGRLKCDKADAFKIQLLAAKELAPYLHQKLPVAEDGEPNRLWMTFEVSQAVGEMLQLEPEDDGAIVIEGEIADDNKKNGKSKG